MKNWLAGIALICFCTVANAQVATDLQQFQSWLGQQQGHAGIGYLAKGDKAKYAVSWWDLIQVGQSGLNLAQPSKAHDYVDLSPANGSANDRAPRWGMAIPIHFGNIWNDIHLTAAIDSHINKAPLPNIIVSYIFLLPADGLPVTKMRPWDRDGMVAITYGFGGN